MTTIEQIMALSAAYGAARSVSEARVSTQVFNDGKRIQRVRDGADIGVRSAERAVQWFADNWPEHAVWPDGVPRPPRSRNGEAA